jgi:hypothetical protein
VGPSFATSAVETLRRKIERSNLKRAPARARAGQRHGGEGDRRRRRIKYHNAPGASIGIRCNQFGGGPKAAACKSGLRGISLADTDGNQAPLRGRRSGIPRELDSERTRCEWQLEKNAEGPQSRAIAGEAATFSPFPSLSLSLSLSSLAGASLPAVDSA